MRRKKPYELAEIDYLNGMEYKEIAEKYGVSPNTVKSWRQRYWNKEQRQKAQEYAIKCKKDSKRDAIGISNYIGKVQEICDRHTDIEEKHKEFCILYTKSHNATRSYMQVYGSQYFSAATQACELLKLPKIKAFIKELQDEKIKTMLAVTTDDIIQELAEIAFEPIDPNVPTGKAEKIRALTELQRMITQQQQQLMGVDNENGGVIQIPAIDEDI